MRLRSFRWSALLLIFAFLTVPLHGSEEPSKGPLLGEDEWLVQVMPGPHPGPYRLKVQVDLSKPWPRVADEAVSFQVAIRSPDGSVRPVGWLTESYRSLSASIPLGDDVILLGQDREAANSLAKKRRQEFLGALEAISLASWEQPPSAKHLGIVENQLSLSMPQAIEHPPAILWKYEVLLSPRAGGQMLRQDLGPRAPEPPRYTWRTEVSEPDDPCFGKTPEACVLERLEAIRDRLCNTLKADGAPRYYFECIVFSLKLSSEPPRVEIECNLDGATAGVVPSDDLLHRLRINGEYFLTGDCLEGTILHELTHIFDIAAGRLTASLRLARLAQRLSEARRVLGELLDNPRPQDPAYLPQLQAAMAQLEAAREAYGALAAQLPEAATQRLASECRALFAELENWDFLGPPEETLPWIVDSIQATIEQQILLPKHLGVPETDETAAVRCACFRRIREWLRQNPTVEAAMANENSPHGEGSWLDFLDHVISVYCQ